MIKAKTKILDKKSQASSMKKVKALRDNLKKRKKQVKYIEGGSKN